MADLVYAHFCDNSNRSWNKSSSVALVPTVVATAAAAATTMTGTQAAQDEERPTGELCPVALSAPIAEFRLAMVAWQR